MTNDNREIIDEVTKACVDNGRLIEAGWFGFKSVVLKGAGELQTSEMRKAFFAGAQHLFASIMSFLEEGQEATDADFKRLEQVNIELAEFIKTFKEENFV